MKSNRFDYNGDDFARDVHAGIVVLAGFLVVRLPQITSFTLAQFEQDVITVAVMFVVAFLKSYLSGKPGGTV